MKDHVPSIIIFKVDKHISYINCSNVEFNLLAKSGEFQLTPVCAIRDIEFLYKITKQQELFYGKYVVLRANVMNMIYTYFKDNQRKTGCFKDIFNDLNNIDYYNNTLIAHLEYLEAPSSF